MAHATKRKHRPTPGHQSPEHRRSPPDATNPLPAHRDTARDERREADEETGEKSRRPGGPGDASLADAAEPQQPEGPSPDVRPTAAKPPHAGIDPFPRPPRADRPVRGPAKE